MFHIAVRPEVTNVRKGGGVIERYREVLPVSDTTPVV
jgi:hypothetical protein